MNVWKQIGLLLVLLVAWTFAAGQQIGKEKYWILFKDKAGIETGQSAIALSERALARRERQGIALDDRDLAPNRTYLSHLQSMGLELRHPSRWLNGISAWLSEAELAQVATLPFVSALKPIPKVQVEYDFPSETNTRAGYEPGFAAAQLEMIGLDKLHQNGYNGRGILISVMDNGFRGANENPHLAHLFANNQIVATHSFVNGSDEVFQQGNHGQWVLSILAAWTETAADPGFWFYGSAHGADFILCHTEDDASETHQEEDNWVAAMEYADSIGADIFSTSLGYRNFDNGDDYGYQGMDGNTTIITIAADIAASRGILVVNSAGNSGSQKMMAPSDGDSVLSVGAVDSNRVIASFSSQGPTPDGRIKPNISAMGQATAFIQMNGTLSRGNGTSFSCPVASGMAACLLQAAPNTRSMDLFDAILQSSDRHANPDTIYGHGIPNAPEAFRILTGEELSGALATSSMDENGMGIFPNPAKSQLNVVIDNDASAYEANLEIHDMLGRKVMQRRILVAPFYNVLQLSRSSDLAALPEGSYGLVLRDLDGEVLFKQRFSLID